jgi:hypothetical protein
VVADAGEPLKGQLMNSMDEAAQGELNGLRRDGNTPRRSTAMSIPHYVNERQSDIRAIKPGWYGMESNGKLSSGPFPNQEKCLTGITQPRSNSRASPWRHATHNPEVAANKARDKKAAMDYLAHAQAAMDARD